MATKTGRLRGWPRRTYDLLASGRLAVVLLTALIVLHLLYLFLPQASGPRAQPVERWVETAGSLGKLCHLLGLTDVQHSALLAGTYGLLAVNLLLCMIRRFRAATTQWRMPARRPDPTDAWTRLEVRASGIGTDRVAARLRRRGYRTLVEGDTVYGLRGRFGVVGHWLFHVSFLVLLAGGAYVAARPAAFRGTVAIGEGEPFRLQEAEFLATNRSLPSDLPGIEFTLERVDAAPDGTEMRAFDAVVTTPDGERFTLGINRPYRTEPYQVLLQGFGYMPGWVIVDASGRMLRGAWVKLMPFPLQDEESFPFGPPQSAVHVTFFPDHETTEDGDWNRSLALENPRFRTRVVLRGEEIFAGLLEPGQRVPIEGDRAFFFLPEIRRYALLDVIEEGSHPIFFTGFGVMIVGVFLRYARIRKELLVHVRDGSLVIFGRAEILEHLFAEELDRLAVELGDGRHPLATQEGFA